jgi:hypothetical protein
MPVKGLQGMQAFGNGGAFGSNTRRTVILFVDGDPHPISLNV